MKGKYYIVNAQTRLSKSSLMFSHVVDSNRHGGVGK